MIEVTLKLASCWTYKRSAPPVAQNQGIDVNGTPGILRLRAPRCLLLEDLPGTHRAISFLSVRS